MAVRFVLTGYAGEALDQAVYDRLDEGTFAGRRPACPGAVASGDSLRRCEAELCSTIEDWLLVGLRSGHQLPVRGGIDLDGSADAMPRAGGSRANDGTTFGASGGGFMGPVAGTRHQFMTFEQLRLAIPSNDEYPVPQLRFMFDEVAVIFGHTVDAAEWESLR